MKTIYYNGEVYNGELPFKQAFIVKDGRFIFVGDTESAIDMADAGDVLVDLEKRFVCSGFNDSHMHLLGFGKALQQGDLTKHTESLEDIVEKWSFCKQWFGLSGRAS